MSCGCRIQIVLWRSRYLLLWGFKATFSFSSNTRPHVQSYKTLKEHIEESSWIIVIARSADVLQHNANYNWMQKCLCSVPITTNV